VFLKLEILQHTGSFKFRGACNRLAMIAQSARANGVVAFSSGNHAQGVAAAAQLFGMPAVIVMPSDAPRPRSRALAPLARASWNMTGCARTAKPSRPGLCRAWRVLVGLAHPVIFHDARAKGASALDLGARRIRRHHDHRRHAEQLRRRATPWAWLPRRKGHNAIGPGALGNHGQPLQAPRNLNEPVCCRISSFRNTRPPVKAFNAGLSTSGVRTA